MAIIWMSCIENLLAMMVLKMRLVFGKNSNFMNAESYYRPSTKESDSSRKPAGVRILLRNN